MSKLGLQVATRKNTLAACVTSPGSLLSSNTHTCRQHSASIGLAQTSALHTAGHSTQLVVSFRCNLIQINVRAQPEDQQINVRLMQSQIVMGNKKLKHSMHILPCCCHMPSPPLRHPFFSLSLLLKSCPVPLSIAQNTHDLQLHRTWYAE